LKKHGKLAIALVVIGSVLTGCASNSVSAIDEIITDLELTSISTVLASDEFGHEKRIEGDPPTKALLLANAPGLRREIESRLTDEGFSLASPNYWSHDLGEDGTAWARIEEYAPDDTSIDTDDDERRVPKSGAVLISIYIE
jgi:hypothetical protein